jgi:hypothetical protein
MNRVAGPLGSWGSSYDEFECSQAIVHRIVQIHDESVITYVLRVKHVKELKADTAGFVKERVFEVR